MWEQIEPGKWRVPPWTDSDGTPGLRQLLHAVDGDLVELYGGTLVIYAAPESIADPAWPLADAVYERMVDAPQLAELAEPDVWQAMADLSREAS